jgi:hypothetical protein
LKQGVFRVEFKMAPAAAAAVTIKASKTITTTTRATTREAAQ